MSQQNQRQAASAKKQDKQSKSWFSSNNNNSSNDLNQSKQQQQQQQQQKTNPQQQQQHHQQQQQKTNHPSAPHHPSAAHHPSAPPPAVAAAASVIADFLSKQFAAEQLGPNGQPMNRYNPQLPQQLHIHQGHPPNLKPIFKAVINTVPNGQPNNGNSTAPSGPSFTITQLNHAGMDTQTNGGKSSGSKAKLTIRSNGNPNQANPSAQTANSKSNNPSMPNNQGEVLNVIEFDLQGHHVNAQQHSSASAATLKQAKKNGNAKTQQPPPPPQLRHTINIDSNGVITATASTDPFDAEDQEDDFEYDLNYVHNENGMAGEHVNQVAITNANGNDPQDFFKVLDDTLYAQLGYTPGVPSPHPPNFHQMPKITFNQRPSHHPHQQHQQQHQQQQQAYAKNSNYYTNGQHQQQHHYPYHSHCHSHSQNSPYPLYHPRCPCQLISLPCSY